jgi:hypothetical protein
LRWPQRVSSAGKCSRSGLGRGRRSGRAPGRALHRLLHSPFASPRRSGSLPPAGEHTQPWCGVVPKRAAIDDPDLEPLWESMNGTTRKRAE